MATQTKLKEAAAPDTGLPAHATLAGAICAVMDEVGAVKMTGRLPVGGGRVVEVASIGDIANALQPLMAKHGVVMFPTAIESETAVVGKTRSDTDIFRTDARVSFKLLHRDSDQTDTVMVLAQGSDPGDKGASKAMTGAQKYAHRLLFQLPTEHDPDNNQSTETTRRPSPAPARQPAPQPASAPSQEAPPAEPDPDAPVMGMWEDKGKRADELSDGHLQWYLKVYRENVQDPKKDSYRAENQRTLDSLESEAHTRAEEKTGTNDTADLKMRDKLEAGFSILTREAKRPRKDLLAEVGSYVHAGTGEKVVPLKVTDITRSRNAAQYVWLKLETELLKVLGCDAQMLDKLLFEECPF